MKNQKLLLKKMSGVSLMLLLFLFISNCASGDKIFSTDVWNITYDDQQGGIALTYKSKNICNGMYASYQWEGKEIKTSDYARHKISTGKVSDSFGKGHIYKVEYTDKELPKLTQYFYLYPGKEYILTDFTVEAKRKSVPAEWLLLMSILYPDSCRQVITVLFLFRSTMTNGSDISLTRLVSIHW